MITSSALVTSCSCGSSPPDAMLVCQASTMLPLEAAFPSAPSMHTNGGGADAPAATVRAVSVLPAPPPPPRQTGVTKESGAPVWRRPCRRHCRGRFQPERHSPLPSQTLLPEPCAECSSAMQDCRVPFWAERDRRHTLITRGPGWTETQTGDRGTLLPMAGRGSLVTGGRIGCAAMGGSRPSNPSVREEGR